MRNTLKSVAIAATALTAAAYGLSSFSLQDVAARLAYGVTQRAATTAAVAAEATTDAATENTDTDRHAILALVNAHRRGASPELCERLVEAIYQESTLADMDPLMVASIVAKESSFKSRIVSHAGAVGLMQLRPFVARDVALRRQVEWNGVETLHSPDLNVRLGILYYKELVDRFDGDHQVALTAYNQGPTRVSRKLRSGTYSGSSYADGILGLYASIRAEGTQSKT